MVSEMKDLTLTDFVKIVLILVLVEDGLGGTLHSARLFLFMGLNPCFSGGWSRRTALLFKGDNSGRVLILVLVEDGLGETSKTATACLTSSLNPCFSGGWSRRPPSYVTRKYIDGLNPCFSGGWSRSACNARKRKRTRVLILVLVEDGLGVLVPAEKADNTIVLILVLVEDGLGALLSSTPHSLNSKS